MMKLLNALIDPIVLRAGTYILWKRKSAVRQRHQKCVRHMPTLLVETRNATDIRTHAVESHSTRVYLWLCRVLKNTSHTAVTTGATSRSMPTSLREIVSN